MQQITFIVVRFEDTSGLEGAIRHYRAAVIEIYDTKTRDGSNAIDFYKVSFCISTVQSVPDLFHHLRFTLCGKTS